MRSLSVAVRSVVSVLLFACVPMANAVSRDISAIFRPDASKPNLNQFTNTTPVSGYCTVFPADCAATKIFSIQVPITFNSVSPIQANHTDYRQGATFKVPVNWRTAQVTHAGTGETETVEVRFSGIGSRYRLPTSVLNLIGNPDISITLAHNRLWGGYGNSWVNPPSPCGYSGHGGLDARTYRFFWKTRVEAACSKKASFLIPSFTYDYLDFAYELRTPNPLKMSSGLYTGSLTFSIGPGQDLDMGDVMIPSDPVLTFDFRLTVEHTLKIEVPPGGNRIDLVPQEGWQSWLNSGRKPTRLFRDQRFHISASSRFKMGLECQYVSGNTCAISETDTGHAVPVDVSVTLPDGLTDAAGQPVNRRQLRLDGSGTELFQPGIYVDRRSGTLHFEVARSHVEAMLDTGAKAYSGNVTVIWDSEV